jgi:Rod binding domain-containing protein
MNIPAISAASQTQRAVETPSLANQKKATEAGRQFDAMFLRQALGGALKLSSNTAMGARTPGASVYQSFVTDILADNISQSGAMGISRLAQSQLQSNH